MELWTPEHARTLLPAVGVFLALAVVLRLTMGRLPHKMRMIPFQIIACLLVLIEIGKQVGSFARGYDLYHLPLHFCSLFIFAMPIMAFYRGKHQTAVRAVTAALSSAMTLLLLIYPNLIYSAQNVRDFFTDYFSFHTVAFHNLVVLQFFLIVSLRLHETEAKREPVYPVVFICCFCAVSATMAQVLKTNFANFYSCNIPVLEAVRVGLQPVLGSVVTQILYILINTALHIVFVYGAYWAYRLLRKLTGAKRPALAR